MPAYKHIVSAPSGRTIGPGRTAGPGSLAAPGRTAGPGSLAAPGRTIGPGSLAAPAPRRIPRRQLLTRAMPAGLLGIAAAACGTTTNAGEATQPDRRPLALIYRGPASCKGCGEAVQALLTTDAAPFRTQFCGPGEHTALDAATLATASLYVQPGGGDDLRYAWSHMRPFAGLIRRWVRGGGHYLGICMGGFLAGFDPGFGLLPGDSGEYIRTPGATVHANGDALVTVRWRGQDRSIYFQGGPYFRFRPGASATVLATYTNGTAAAAVARFGAGRVGVSGPHPEAPASWYREAGLAEPRPPDRDLGHDLVQATMGRTAAA